VSIRIPDLLDGILEATAAEAAAKVRVSTYRAALEDEARRRYDADGAAPAWTAPDLGKVRLEPPGPWTAVVADAVAFGDHVLEHYPTEAVLVIEVPGTDAQAAGEALAFAGVTARARVETRPAWSATYLDSLDVSDDDNGDPSATSAVPDEEVAVDPAGLLVPGITRQRAAAKLVVSLDRNRRTAAINEAREAANVTIVEATGVTDEQLAALDTARRELEALPGDVLAAIAKAHNLGSSGTKAALAERVARAEQASGKVIRTATITPTGVNFRVEAAGGWDEPGDPAEDLEAARRLMDTEATPEPLPDDVEVEEVTTVEQPVDSYDPAAAAADDRRAALLDGLSREALRKYAKAHNISAAGTKADLIARLPAGTTVTDVTTYLNQERTP
jgi:hypothetical protein